MDHPTTSRSALASEPMTLADPVWVRRWLEDHGVAFLERFVALNSLSPAFDPEWERHGTLAAAIDLAAETVEAAGFEGTEIVRQTIPGRSPALAVRIPGRGHGTALVYGHLDVQPAVGPWRDGSDPHRVVRHGERLVGRGVVDDGYSVVAVLAALEGLRAMGADAPTVWALFETSEESGSPDLDAHLDALAPTIGPVDLVVCLDAGGLDTKRLWLTSSLRGNLVVVVDIAVLDHGIHSGEAGGVVPETFRILRALLERLEDPVTGDIRVDALRSAVPEPVREAARALVEALGDPFAGAYPLLEGVRLEGADPVERLLRQSWGTAIALTGIDGVPSVDTGGNVLRPSLTAKLSVRIPPDVDAARALDALVATLSADPPNGARVRVTPETPAQGWAGAALPDWLADALARGSIASFGEPPRSVGVGGSIPFLASLGERFPGVPIVATGALAPTSNAHGPDEVLELPAATGVAVSLAEALGALAQRSF